MTDRWEDLYALLIKGRELLWPETHWAIELEIDCLEVIALGFLT